MLVFDRPHRIGRILRTWSKHGASQREASTATFPNGEVATITSLTPRTERDFVLAQLSKPVTDIAAAPLGSTAPAVADTLTVVGYGRTASTWAPLQPHAGAYSVGQQQWF
jgi:hypothetical protein